MVYGKESLKIIVLEDSDKIAKNCINMLTGEGYTCIEADSVDDVIVQAEPNVCNLLILGVTSGSNSPTETFSHVSKNLPELSGIILTEEASFELVQEAMRVGVSRVVKVPFEPEELVEAINGTLRFLSLQQENARIKTLLPLYRLMERFLSITERQSVYEELASVVMEEMNVPSVSVMMFDKTQRVLKIVAHRGLKDSNVEQIELRPGEQIAGKVFQTKHPLIFNRNTQHLSPLVKLLKREELSASICFPIIVDDKTIGVLNVSDTNDGTNFSEADIDMLSVITSQAMMALANLKSMQEREEQSRIRTQLEQYVSPELSNLLVNRHQDLMELGEVTDLTVLFADIRNFTSLVQKLEPELLRIFLNSFFDIFSRAVFANKGMLDKFMGDAALVVFGAPVYIENQSIAAMQTAKRIMQEFDVLRTHWAERSPVFKQVGLGIGLSRGPIYLGNIGSSQRFDYTVIGIDVNIAQRLAAQTLSGQILYTQRVNDGLGDMAKTSFARVMNLRGIDSELKVYSSD